MIQVNLDDPKLVENVKAIEFLKSTGLYTDEQLQELYEKQIEADRKQE